jgi:hypothetical protein
MSEATDEHKRIFLIEKRVRYFKSVNTIQQMFRSNRATGNITKSRF